MRTIVLALLGWIARGLDPELQSRIDALNAKVAAAEAREREATELQRLSEQRYEESAAAFAASEAERQELDLRLTDSYLSRAMLQERFRLSEEIRKELRDEVEQANAVVDARTDDDLIFGGVPKPAAPSGEVAEGS